MKRILIFTMVILATFSLMIGCSNETAEAESQIATVSFSNTQTKSLEEIKPDFVGVDDETIEWYYKATKASDSNFLTGEAKNWTIIPASGDGKTAGKLDNQIRFSLGKWDFALQARLVSDHTTKVYEGSREGVLLNNANGVTTVKIDVSPVIEGVDGFIQLQDVYIKSASGSQVAPNVFKIGDTSYSITTDEANGTISSNPIKLPIGTYTVGVAYIKDGAVNAAETKTVQVYSGRITKVKGFIGEQTGIVEFNPVFEKGIAIVTAKATEETTFALNNVTPSGLIGCATEATFEAGALEAGDYKLTATVSNEIENGNYTVTGGNDTVASLDINLYKGDATIQTFNEKTVTITTYIAKGLTTANIKVEGPADATVKVVDYDATTGKLIFTTNHFSEYKVTYTGDIGVYNLTTKTCYASLSVAVNEVPTGSELKVLCDLELDNTVTINKKALTLDLAGHKITFVELAEKYTNCGIQIYEDAFLTVNDTVGTGVIEFTQTIGEEPAMHGIFVLWPDNGKSSLTINGGKFIAAGIPITGSGNIVNGPSISITINDGVFESQKGLVIYHPGDGDVTINGGSFKGRESAIEIRSGSLTINGGEFESTSAPLKKKPNGSGTTTEGAAIAIAQHKTKRPISVTINDGIFKGFSALYESNPENNSAEDIAKVKVFVNGGTFEAINGGTVAVYSEDCKSFISNGTFSDLVSPLKYAADGATIKLACDAEGGGLGSADGNKTMDSLTIDLEGHTYVMVKDPVGSKGSETQAMHWGSSLGLITIKNGTFKVNCPTAEFAIKSQTSFTAENMIFDFSNMTPRYYGNSYTGQFEIFNGLEASLFTSEAGKMLLKGCKVRLPEKSTKGIYVGKELTLEDTMVEGKVSLADVDESILFIKGNSTVREVVNYFPNDVVGEPTIVDGVKQYKLVPTTIN